MNTGPLEATAWTILIIAVLFVLGFGVLGVVDFLRAGPGHRGLRVTAKEKGFLLAMAAAIAPPLIMELLMRSFSPFLLLAIAVPLAVVVVFVSRRLSSHT